MSADRIAPDITPPGRIVSLMLYGSHAHGTATPTSDEDWRGVFIAPTEAFLGIRTPPQTYEQKPDIVMWEVSQFARLLLKGNPNIVGMLWTPEDCIILDGDPMPAFRAIRESLITRHTIAAYIGWAVSELGRALTPKQLSHVPRLMWEIQDAITYRRIPVRLDDKRRGVVMAIKTGQMPMDEGLKIARDLLARVRQLADAATFPEAPTQAVTDIVLAAHSTPQRRAKPVSPTPAGVLHDAKPTPRVPQHPATGGPT